MDSWCVGDSLKKLVMKRTNHWLCGQALLCRSLISPLLLYLANGLLATPLFFCYLKLIKNNIFLAKLKHTIHKTSGGIYLTTVEKNWFAINTLAKTWLFVHTVGMISTRPMCVEAYGHCSTKVFWIYFNQAFENLYIV